MAILELNKELQEELNKGFKEIENLCEDIIETAQDAKSSYDKYILDEEYPRLLGRYIKEIEENKRLMEEIKLKNNRIYYLEDKLSRDNRLI